METPATPLAPGMTRLQKVLLVGLVVLLVASVAARAVFLGTRTDSTPAAVVQPQNFVTSVDSSAAAGEPREGATGAIEEALPYVTEASLFGLIGFALGYATRKVFKLALLGIAAAFILLQVLVHYEVLDVEWGPVVDWLNRAVMNLKESESLTSFLTKRVPSVGALLAGAFVGFQRG